MDNKDREYIDGIVNAPDDDAPRLQYADYLTSINNPRGEFIRVQCAIAERASHGEEYWTLKQRELDLLAIHGPEWRARVCAALSPRSPVDPIEFQRGFVESLSAYTDYFESRGPVLLENIPTLRHLVVTMYDRTSPKRSVWEEVGLGDDPPEHTADELSRYPRFGQIDRLHIKSDPMSGEPPTSDQLAALLGSPGLRALKSLEFFRLSFDRRFSRMLGTIPALEQLRELTFRDLSDGCIPSVHKTGLTQTLESFTASGMWNRKSMKELLGRGGTFPRLKRFEFDSSDLDDRVIKAWSKNGKISPIEFLRLEGTFSENGVAAVVDSPWAVRLKTLSLSSLEMQGNALMAVADCAARESLEELAVEDAVIGIRGVQTFARSSFPQLQRIRLAAESEFGREQALALVEAPWWGQLTSFALWHCLIDCDAAEILGKNWPSQLELLDFTRCDLSHAQIPSLFPSNRPLQSLRHLSISGCAIGESELSHLSHCDVFPRILSLDLSWNPLNETGFCELVESSLAERLRVFDLRDVEEIGVRGSRAMAASSRLEHLCEARLGGCDLDIDYDCLEERFGDRLV